MKIKNITLISLFVFISSIVFADNVPLDIAKQVATNFFYEKTNIKQEQINFEEAIIINNENINFYYIFNVEDKSGFVIISADDAINPFLGYSLNSKFETENQPENVEKWMQQYKDQIIYVKENNILATLEIKNIWQNYNTKYSNFIKNPSKEIIVAPLTRSITWDQGAGWNELCPADENGPGGHVYAGCVATAMGIVMKYWEYPMQGTGSHTYYPSGYGEQYANYGETTYFWSYMSDNRANYYSALLLYHLGISVEMMYSPDGSGAYSHDVPYALETYFGYDSNISYKNKENYSNTEWANLLKEQLDDSKPMYYSGCSNSGCHAIVCDGYDSNDFFHYNFGWSGSSNGFYSLSDVGGFPYYNAVVINIQPPSSHSPLLPVTTLTAELDYVQENKVNLEWNIDKNNKSLTGFNLYRGDELIEENLSVSTSSYSDIAVADGDYFYGIRALYNEGEAICAADFIEVKSNFEITFQVRKNANTVINNPFPTVTFNGETKSTNFIGEVIFEDVSLGTNQEYIVEHPDYNAINDFTNTNSDNKVFVYFDNNTKIEEEKQQDLLIYPNPSNTGIFTVKKLQGFQNLIKYEIIDLTGRVLYSNNYSILDNHLTIDISNYAKGVYILKIATKTQISSHKIIIE